MNLYKQCERTSPFWTGLRQRNYTLEESTVADKPVIKCTSPSGRSWLTSTNVSYPMNSPISQLIASNKDVAYDLAAALGVRIPITITIGADQLSEACDLLSEIKTVVVKPVDGHGSMGVSCDITTADQLDLALSLAFKYSDKVIVQEQVSGQEVRFTALNGEVVSAVLRQSPQVVGDGKTTVADLIKRENIERQNINLKFVNYPLLAPDLIAENYFEDQTVPSEHEVIRLSNATMIKTGASMYEVLDDVDRTYIKLVQNLAREVGAGFVAVDMFMVDHTVSHDSAMYWFNEFNTSPALALYYASRGRDVSSVAEKVLDAFDAAVNY